MCSKASDLFKLYLLKLGTTFNEVSEIEEGVEDKPLYNVNVFKLT